MIRHLIPNIHQDNANNKLHQTSQFITEINVSFSIKEQHSQTCYARSSSVTEIRVAQLPI
jgi:hypothetical protein